MGDDDNDALAAIIKIKWLINIHTLYKSTELTKRNKDFDDLRGKFDNSTWEEYDILLRHS